MRTILTLLIACSLFSCKGEKGADTKTEKKSKQQSVVRYVDTLHLSKQTFNKQIVCNGKLRAITKSDINFTSTGAIAKINITNGDNISKGTLLAQLDTEDANIDLEKAKRSMAKARLDLRDKLIGQGYNSDTVDVPKTILENAQHTSGYNNALDNLAKAERNLADCYIYAPFSGRVANVESKIYDKPKSILCTLIDDNYFDVEFNLLEAELSEVQKGQKIFISPFIDEKRSYRGEVTQINPLIDEKGQIKIRAKVRNSDNYLIEGMNVKLILNREIKNQYIVPKDAVVLRDGFHVVFRYDNGKAVWTYVDVVESNINSHLITGSKSKETTLADNDAIIISGNRNLADGVKVNLK